MKPGFRERDAGRSADYEINVASCEAEVAHDRSRIESGYVERRNLGKPLEERSAIEIQRLNSVCIVLDGVDNAIACLLYA